MLQDEISEWPPQGLANVLMQFSKNTLQPSYLKLNTIVTKLKIKNITDFLWTLQMKEMTDALLHLNWRLTKQVVKSLPRGLSCIVPGE